MFRYCIASIQFFMSFDGERSDEPQASGRIGENAHHQRASFDFLHQPPFM
jgi:hypothetical protein